MERTSCESLVNRCKQEVRYIVFARFSILYVCFVLVRPLHVMHGGRKCPLSLHLPYPLLPPRLPFIPSFLVSFLLQSKQILEAASASKIHWSHPKFTTFCGEWTVARALHVHRLMTCLFVPAYGLCSVCALAVRTCLPRAFVVMWYL